VPSISDAASQGRGKPWAYAGAIVGGAVSVAANVAHSFVPGQLAGMSDEAWRALPDAHPQPGAVMLAAFWPMALLLAVEVLARVDWPTERRWTALRWGGVTPVAVVAAIVSYLHLSGLLHWYGEESLTVAIGPAAVDGLMVISTGALLALASRSGRIGSGVAVPAEAMRPMVPMQAMRPESIASDAPLAPIASDARESIGSDRVDAPGAIVDRIEDLIGASESIESGSIGSDPVRGGAVVSIESHRHPGTGTRSSQGREARPDDVARVREAIKAGRLTQPVRVKHVMEQLSIGPTYARAAVDYVTAHGTQGQAEG
jgi:hypothetical protein